MKRNLRAIFIDGEVNDETIAAFKHDLIFSSEENEKLAVSLFQIDKSKEELSKAKTIEQIVRFYNKLDSHFLRLEANFGINIWFLEHFRINFQFIEKQKKAIFEKDFLTTYPTGKIVKPKQKKSKLKLFFRALNELLFIVLNAFSREKFLIGNVLIHNEGGTNFSAQELFGDLSKNYPIIKIRSLLDLKRPLPKRSKLSTFQNSDKLFFRTVCSPKTWVQLNAFNTSLGSIFSEIEKTPITHFEQEILNHLKSKRTYFSIMFLRFLSFKNYFERSGIESIVLSDENSPQQKVIMYAAKKTSVKIFAIQHGAIYQNHFAYTFGKYNHPPVLPDITFTWGEYYNEVLLRYGGYKESEVKAVGSLRKTPITRSNKEEAKEYTQVLFATQPIPNETLRKQYLRDVFLCFKELDDVLNYKLVLRPHPNEKDDSYFHKVSEEVGFRNYTIERNVKIENHFDSSDILITAYSTVGAEFVEYFKPIVVLDYLNEDMVGYINEGIGIQINNRVELISRFKQNKLEVNRSAYERFITRFFHATDGNAAKRVMQHIAVFLSEDK